ncbi:hypothetical protein AB1A65_08475 [Muricauda sp. ANG21]|uniref:hypothetical protein n=1 Tax=Allomuricauda sp. ANG21 TaxID=3042468 RepID=UPI003454A7F3
MKKILILILTILPLPLLGQQLECCKSVEEVGKEINGYWKMKSPDKNEQLKFEFNNGIGKFWRYKFNEKNDLIETKEIDQKLEIFETKSGFEMDWSNGNRIGTSKIKVLNTTTLVFVRRDGKETEYYKIAE